MDLGMATASCRRSPSARTARFASGPRACTGCCGSSRRRDFIVESDQRPAADEDDERRRYFALTPHGKRVLDAEVRRLEAIVHHARSSRALRKAASRMTSDRRCGSAPELRTIWCFGSRLLESGVRDDSGRAQRSALQRRGSRFSGISSSSEPRTISHRHCGRSFDLRPSPSAFHSSLHSVSLRQRRSSRLLTRCCCDRCLTIDRIGSSRCGNRMPARIACAKGPSPGNVVDWVARNDAFDAITADDDGLGHAPGTDGGTPIAGVHVTRGFFDVYRRQPRLGRTFLPDEFEGAMSITSRQASSGQPVIVLSHRLWRALGADPRLVGRTVYIEGRDWRVIGVMPEDFAVPDAAAAFWAPWDMRVSFRPRFRRDPSRLQVFARRRPDESRDAHRGRAAQMRALARGLESEHPDTNAGWCSASPSRTKSHAEPSGTPPRLCRDVLPAVAGLRQRRQSRDRTRGRPLKGNRDSPRDGGHGGRVTRQLIAESLLSAIVTTASPSSWLRGGSTRRCR